MLKFSKLHGAGNDFSLFDGINQQLPDYSALAKAACDRHFGTGGDGIMVALPSRKADVRMIYVNSDGSPGEMCGNGLRCFSRFVYEKGLVSKPAFTVETDAGLMSAEMNLDADNKVKSVKIVIGKPLFESEAVPTTLSSETAPASADASPEGRALITARLDLDGRPMTISALRMAAPHCVILVPDLEALDICELGSMLEWHPVFPAGINVNFIQVIDRRHIRIKTWERGAHHTLACGTGSCSGVVVGNQLGLLDRQVEVTTEGGILNVSISPEYIVTLDGEAEFICDGEYSAWLVERAKAFG